MKENTLYGCPLGSPSGHVTSGARNRSLKICHGHPVGVVLAD